MKTIFQAAVVLLLAIPFAYMLFDVTRDILNQVWFGLTKKVKPVLINTIQSLFS